MRVLVVDDSTIFRKVVRDALAELSGVQVVGVAGDGQAALDKIDQLKPDLVTLDIEMPILGGIEVLRQLKTHDHHPEVIMLSALTERNATVTTQALRLGAFDFVLKPSQSSMEESRQQLRQDLLPKISALQERSEEIREPTKRPNPQSKPELPRAPLVHATAPKVIAIGISTGGPPALCAMLPKLPADLPVPILIVQHMPPIFTRSLADDLDKLCQLVVHEAEDGQRIEPGHVYIAPGGKQMKVCRLGERRFLRVTDDPPERSCKPSVDYLFRSVAHAYQSDALGVIMTGMGDDGSMGCRLLKRNGCKIVVQDEETCVVYGMPRQVVEAGLADAVCPLHELDEVILHAVDAGVPACN